MEVMQKISKAISELIAWLLVLFAVASCSTAEQLVDRAVKKDPTILEQHTDTVSFTLVTVDSVLINVGDTVVWDKVVREYHVDTVISYDLINIERRKTRQEIRKNARLERLKERLEAKYQDRELELQERLKRLQARLDKRENKDNKKAETKQKKAESSGWLWFLLGCFTGSLASYALRRLMVLRR
jgi:ATP-dependent Lon protease